MKDVSSFSIQLENGPGRLFWKISQAWVFIIASVCFNLLRWIVLFVIINSLCFYFVYFTWYYQSSSSVSVSLCKLMCLSYSVIGLQQLPLPHQRQINILRHLFGNAAPCFCMSTTIHLYSRCYAAWHKYEQKGWFAIVSCQDWCLLVLVIKSQTFHIKIWQDSETTQHWDDFVECILDQDGSVRRSGVSALKWQMVISIDQQSQGLVG